MPTLIESEEALENREEASPMKKLFALAIAAALLLCSFGALAEDLYFGEKVTLEMAVWNSVETYEQINAALLDRFPEIAAKADIEVVIEGDGPEGIAQKIRLLLGSGEDLPDMVRVNYAQFAEFESAGLLYDMTAAVEPYKDDIIPAVLEMMTGGDGGIYCLPQEAKPKVWYYRTDIFEQAGVDPHEVKTADDYIEAGRKVHEATGTWIENYGTPLNAYDLMMILSGNGARFTDDNGDFVVASSQETRDAFELLKKYHDSGAFSDIEEWSADWQAAFTDGTLSSQLIASWMKQHLLTWAPDQAGKWGCALWPEELQGGSDAGMGIWLVFKNAPHAELAADILAKYSFDPEFRRAVYAINAVIPPLESAKTDDFYAASDYFDSSLRDVYFEALEQLSAYPYEPTFTAEQTIIRDYLNEYVNGNISLDDALAQAEADMKNQIGNAYD